MPRKSYALERGEPKRVEVEWRAMWRDVRVRVDGADLGVFKDMKELLRGRDFPLVQGGNLQVQLVRSFPSVELHVTRDGEPLPGSTTDPNERVKQAAYTLYFIAGLNVVVGLVAAVGNIDFLLSLGAGWGSVVEGLLYGFFAWGTWKRWRIALILGMALFALDTAFAIFTMVQAIAQSGGASGSGGIVARLVFLMPLGSGLRGMADLRKKSPTETR